MSRLDITTIGVVALLIAAIIYLLYKTPGVFNKKDENITQTESTIAYPEDRPYPMDDDGSIIKDKASLDDMANDEAAYSDLEEDESIGGRITTTARDGVNTTSDAIGKVANKAKETAENVADAVEEKLGGNSKRDMETTTTTYEETESVPVSYNDEEYGNYFVVAGSFKVKENAQNMVNQLLRKGYNNAEMEPFNRGAYATVLVDRFERLSAARALVNELNASGIEAYVHKKRLRQR